MKCRWHAVVRLLGLAVAGIYYAAASGNLAGVQDSAAGVGLAAPTQRVVLEYQETTNAIYRSGVRIWSYTKPFKRDPDQTNHQFFRGYLEIGRSTNDHLPLVWDFERGRLWLDLNRNRDLTDDAKGFFAPTGVFSKRSQIFTNIHVTFQAERGAFESCLDLHLTYHGNARAYATFRSMWTGKAPLGGRDWQVGWIEGLTNAPNTDEPRYLLLRPWEARQEPVYAENGMLDAFRFNRLLCWGNQSYELVCAYDADANTPRRAIEFRAREPKLGELKLVGTMIDRLMLQGEPYSVVLDAPPPVVKVPVGNYAYARVQLRTNQTRAWGALPQLWVWRAKSAATNWMAIGEERPAVLAIGGPLTNSVMFSRGEGQALGLYYQLQGAGGTGYFPVSSGGVPPRWTVYQGRRELASGAFEFG